MVAALLLLCTFGAPRASPQQTLSPLDEGIKHLADGHFIEALAAFNRFKQTSPQDARPYFYSGIALTETGRLSAAALELAEAVRLDPGRLEYLVFQANVLSRLKQKAHAVSALALFEQQDLAKKLDTAWLWLLTDVYYRLEENDDALRVLELLSERNPRDHRIDLTRGQIHQAKGELDLAEEAFNRSIEKSADNALAYFELGKVLHQRNKMEASKEALLEAVRQQPTHPEYLHQLGVVCLALGQPDQALEYLRRAEPSASNFPQVYYALGNAYQRNGDAAKAVQYRKKFEEVSTAQRKKEDRDREVGRLIVQGEKQLDEGNRAAAQTLFERALEADANNWDGHGYLAEMLLSSGDLQRAHKHLVKMEELDPDSVVGNYLMAKYWYQRKELDRARAYAENVKLARPGHAELRNLLGHIYLGLGQQEKALREYEAAVQLAPDRADFRENLRTIENRIPPTPPKVQKP